VVGFDDLATSQYASPPLTSVQQSAYELGRLAASAMLQLLSKTKPTVEVPAPRLIARESSSAART
jgi:LacI family transcriptional regulator